QVRTALVEYDGATGDYSEIEPGGVVDFTENGAGNNGTLPAVQFYVTWEGDAALTVDTAAFLVADGWVVNHAYQLHTDLLGDRPWAEQPNPDYDPLTQRTSTVSSGDLFP